MLVYYKFGLLLIFILSISICHRVLATPATNQSIYDDYYDDDDDYFDDEKQETGTSENIRLQATSSTTTTTFRPIFHIPRRSNHVLEPTCPRACLCLEDFKYVQCSNARLTQIPHDLPKTALIIDLSHNSISEIRAEDFINNTRAVEINLNWNELHKIDKEAFSGLKRLQRLRLANNHLTQIDPNTFEGANDLSLLDLSNNTIELRKDGVHGSFLNLPNLIDFSCSNCSWTQLYDNSFSNLTKLTILRLDHNDFNNKINTKAFAPLRNLIKLKLPELNQENIQELCNLLKSIDNISFKHFDISCFELVLGTSFNESLIFATDPPYKRVTGLEAAATTTTAKPTAAKVNNNSNNKKSAANSKMASSSTQFNNTSVEAENVVKASVALGGAAAADVETSTEPQKPYQVPISQEAINTLLICIMIIAVIGIIIGLIFRKDIGGIKTKCCRTRKPEPKDQVHPAEEIPLNKLA